MLPFRAQELIIMNQKLSSVIFATALSMILSGCGNPLATLIEEAKEDYQRKLAAAPECKMSKTQFKGEVENLKTELKEIQKDWALSLAFKANPTLTQADFEANGTKDYGKYCDQSFIGYDLSSLSTVRSKLKTDSDYAEQARAQAIKIRTFFNDNPESCKSGNELDGNFWFGSDAGKLLPALSKIETYFSNHASGTPTCDELF